VVLRAAGVGGIDALGAPGNEEGWDERWGQCRIREQQVSRLLL